MEWTSVLLGASVSLAVTGLYTMTQLAGIKAEVTAVRRDVDRLLERE